MGLSGGPEGETLIRRAARISARTPGTELLGLHVVPEDGLTDVDPAALDAQRTLLESLGGSYHQTSGEDVVEALLQFAEAENVTQIVLGASRHGRLAAALRAGTGERTIKGSGPIDVHIVTHEEAAGAVAPRLPHPSRGTGPRRYWSALAGTVLLLPLLTLLLTALRSHLDLSSDLVIYLLAVVVVALIGGLYPALFAAVAAALLADYYFTMPVHSLAMERPNEIIALVVFITTAALVGTAAGEAAQRTHQAIRATSEARALSRLATAMMRGQELAALIEQIRENFGLTAVSLLERDTEASPEPRWYVVASAGERPPEKPYEADVESAVDENLTLAARGSGLSTEDRRVLAACAAELGLAHSRGRITGGAAGGRAPSPPPNSMTVSANRHRPSLPKASACSPSLPRSTGRAGAGDAVEGLGVHVEVSVIPTHCGCRCAVDLAGPPPGPVQRSRSPVRGQVGRFMPCSAGR
ncbi:DUF4118 domain-containing protein [Streptomyces sioyaensis]|uniref:DUF4118 domain-containing protein n=1 Tax=Streptomyces sioyaensis TaxID=67364 RepID=UPI0033DF9230